MLCTEHPDLSFCKISLSLVVKENETMVLLQYSYLLTLFFMFNFRYVIFIQHLQHIDPEIMGKK